MYGRRYDIVIAIIILFARVADIKMIYFTQDATLYFTSELVIDQTNFLFNRIY